MGKHSVDNKIEDINKSNENNNTVNEKTKKKKIMHISIILLILIILVVLFGIAYSKYITTKTGSATVELAQMICEMEVQSSEANQTVINPYCVVTVRNYNDADEISETDINFKIEVTPKEDFELPEYYWQDSKGTIIAQSTEATGSFKNGLKDLKEYKIVFLNSGEEDITRLVDFNLVAIQVGE